MASALHADDRDVAAYGAYRLDGDFLRCDVNPGAVSANSRGVYYQTSPSLALLTPRPVSDNSIRVELEDSGTPVDVAPGAERLLGSYTWREGYYSSKYSSLRGA